MLLPPLAGDSEKHDRGSTASTSRDCMINMYKHGKHLKGLHDQYVQVQQTATVLAKIRALRHQLLAVSLGRATLLGHSMSFSIMCSRLRTIACKQMVYNPCAEAAAQVRQRARAESSICISRYVLRTSPPAFPRSS
jgi:hypothetical protein